jgi:hypothetical protein
MTPILIWRRRRRIGGIYRRNTNRIPKGALEFKPLGGRDPGEANCS